MNIYKFKCGFCNYTSSRQGLRKHLRIEHRILNEITNVDNKKKMKQNWVIREKFK